MQGIEGHSKPIYYFLTQYLHVFFPVSLIALAGLVLCLKLRLRNSSIIIAFVAVITVSYSLVGTKLTHYVVPAYPFICLLAALGLQKLSSKVRYSIACAIVIIPLYWWHQIGGYKELYSRDYEPMVHLASLARADASDLTPAPLVVCLTDVPVVKQQILFYSDRPVKQAICDIAKRGITARYFDPIRPDKREIAVRYFDPIPLDSLIGSVSVPLIASAGTFQALEHSGHYELFYIKEDGPLVLGKISRR
jgi:hypothetical protein